MELRETWKQDVSWNNGVFDSLERFVKTKPEENIETFIETEDLDDLYDGFTPPSPKPSGRHIEYMLEYAEQIVENNEN